MTREEHLGWAKQRALDYVDRGELVDAVASMVSDLGKHPDSDSAGTRMACFLGPYEVARGREAVRRWIEGFR